MILSVNAGSSSLKLKLFNENYELIAEGRWEKDSQKLIFIHEFTRKEEIVDFKEHHDVFKKFIVLLNEIVNVKKISIVAHRAVNGGKIFTNTTLITPNVLKEFEKMTELAPLHNPANIACALAALQLLPDTRQYFVFDTAFHTTIPVINKMYALPIRLYEEKGIQKYGFHGISHEDVVCRAAKILNMDLKKLNIISCHLGNGCSISCVKNGVCYDTSMGMTPLEGLTMGTRCGNLDPGIYPKLVTLYGSVENVDKVLNKESGLSGITGGISDMRVLLELKEKEMAYYATLAIAKFIQDIRKTIGAYLMELEYNVDAIVFTGGIGENSIEIVREATQDLDKIGIILSKNPVELTVADSPVKVLQLKADEELAMAKKAMYKYLSELA